MKLELNEKNEIISYLKYGGVDGINFMEFDGAIPDDFEKDFKPYFYLLQNDEIVENPDYVAPSNDVPSGPSNMQTVITAIINEMGDMNEKLNALGGN